MEKVREKARLPAVMCPPRPSQRCLLGRPDGLMWAARVCDRWPGDGRGLAQEPAGRWLRLGWYGGSQAGEQARREQPAGWACPARANGLSNGVIGTRPRAILGAKRAAVPRPHDREEGAGGRLGVLGQDQLAVHVAAVVSISAAGIGTSRTFRRSKIPIDSSHSVMTVGPMIVRTREAPVGSPTYAWTKPAAIERIPA